MKLRIMRVDGANVPGGAALVLCDEEGRMLPEQQAIVLEQEEDETTTVTVRFAVNGRDVILDCGPAVE